MSTEWISKDAEAVTPGSQQQGANDLASRLGGFGLQDPKTGTSSATSAGPSKGVSNVKDSEAKPQTVPDGWNVPASTSTTTPAATPATTSVEPVATSGQSAQELSAPASAPTADDDALASAEKEAEEMSHEDGECLTAFICSINAVCMEARLSVGQISCYLELIAPTLSIR
jgi:hypothetical protein